MATPCCAHPLGVEWSATHAIAPNCAHFGPSDGAGVGHAVGALNTPWRYSPNSQGTTMVIWTMRLWATRPWMSARASAGMGVENADQLPIERSVQNAGSLSHVCVVSISPRYEHEGWYGTVCRLGAVFSTR